MLNVDADGRCAGRVGCLGDVVCSLEVVGGLNTSGKDENLLSAVGGKPPDIVCHGCPAEELSSARGTLDTAYSYRRM